MFLKQMKQKNDRIKLAIYECYRDGKVSRQRTVKPLGFYDELIKEHPDPIAWGKQIAKEMTEEKNKEKQAVSIQIHPMQKIDMRSTNEKNLGSIIALTQYAALGIKVALANFIASKNSKAKYSLNAILRMLVCERIVNPSSKLCAWINKDRYFFKSDFSKSDIYHALDDLAEAKGSIISAMNRKIAKAKIRDMSCVYYDVTNYYFEIDAEDELRKKGVSKEHRPNPIVQMGLLQDEKGIPITYRLFSGNTSDCETMISILSDLKRDNKLDRIVVVADKGLNCSQNIAAAVASGDGFVFSQSIRGTKSNSSIRKWVLDSKDYRNCKDGKIKSIQGYKTIHLKADESDTGKPKNVDVEVKYVAKWSAKYKARAKYERDKARGCGHFLGPNYAT